jgi:hypothetical protein
MPILKENCRRVHTLRITSPAQHTTVTIRVIVRHSRDCRQKHPTYDQYRRKCDRCKALYI